MESVVKQQDGYYIRALDENNQIEIPTTFLEVEKNEGFFIKSDGDNIILIPHKRGEPFDADAIVVKEEKGRLSLPPFVTKAHAYKLTIQEGNIMLEPYKVSCCACGKNPKENEDLLIYQYADFYICGECLDLLEKGKNDAVSSGDIFVISSMRLEK